MLELITSTASAITACGVVLGIIFAIYNWYLKNERQEDAIKAIKEEQAVLTRGVLACLKGLKAISLRHFILLQLRRFVPPSVSQLTGHNCVVDKMQPQWELSHMIVSSSTERT